MNRYATVLATVCILAVTVAAGSAQQTQPALPAPAMTVKVGDKSEPLKLAKVDATVRIFGYLAETRMTMTFANPHNRVLEGELNFPLPEGATVSGYALDIGGKLVDGVVVEKPKAREVFEKIVRQGVDPGLAEQTAGNNFRTRVFPIPAGGTRTVRVDYVAELAPAADGFAYHMPLAFGGKVGELRLRVEVLQAAAEPAVREGGPAGLKFQKWQHGFAAETTLTDAAATKDLIVAVPDVAKQPVLVEKGPDGQVYFCINDLPAPPPAGPLPKAEAPKVVTVLWDASGSRGASDHQRELGILAACLGRFNQATVEVDVVIFRDKAAPPRRFTVERGDTAALIAALKAVQYDGGTQLAAISPAPGAGKPDFYLLFTDGLSNFGAEDPTDLGRPVYVFTADATANHSFLRYLALTTGGEYFNLLRLEDKAVLDSIGQPAFAFLSAWSAGAKVDDTYPRLVQPVHGRFSLAGKLTGDEAKVTLNYGIGGSVLQHNEFTVSAASAVEGNLLRRFWAQKKVDDLAVFPKRNDKAITDVGKEYAIVTPGTSLIVLDRLEQYLEHHITPPRTLPEMYAEYQRQMDTVQMQQKKEKAAKIDKVLAQWEERVKWWHSEFKYAKDFKYIEKADGKGVLAPSPVGALSLSGAAAPSGSHPTATRAPATPAARPTPEPAPRMALPAAVAEAAPGGGGSGAAGLFADDGRTGDKGKDASGEARRGGPGVLIKEWDPATPYLAALRKAEPAERFGVYMTQRGTYGTSPAFFLDCAEFFRDAGDNDLAIEVLSNVAELDLENAALLRVLAHKLAQWDQLELATRLFEKALEMRPEEPQSYRDLALVLARREQYARAIELLNQVVMKEWDQRFPGIEGIALMELNRLMPKAAQAGLDIEKLGVDGRLIKLLDLDVRVVLTWDADSTDIDLWVTEPSGEKVFYGHNRSTIGGRMSDDFTQGYGPEEYCLRKSMTGVYKIEVNYYGTHAARLLGAVTLHVDVFTNYGRPNEQHRSITRRLRDKQETLQVGEIEY
jgi:tetratricopeptide (TPR) repeat protein